MDVSKEITFVKFCFASAFMSKEDLLGLPTEKLNCLYKECMEMVDHCLDMTIMITFVRLCFASAFMSKEDLGLPTEKLICLYKECTEMAKHCHDTYTMVDSCVLFVKHSNSIGRHADSLRCLKEILPFVVEMPEVELAVHEYLSLTYEELKEFNNAVLHANIRVEIAQQLGDKQKEMDGLGFMGKAFSLLACYDNAIECGKKCLGIAQEIESTEYEMKAYECIVYTYKGMQKHEDTILYAHKLLDCAMKANDQKAMMTAYVELETAHFLLKHYQDAINFGKKCIEISRKREDRFGEAQAYLLTAQVHKALSDNDKAIIYCKKCIELVITIGDKHAEAHAYSLLGTIHYFSSKYDDAISNCNKCLHIDKKDNEEKAADVNAYLILGRVNQSLKKYDEAIQNFKQCIDIVGSIGREKEAGAGACLYLGEIYKTCMNQYNDAVYYYKKCIDMEQETGQKTMEGQACLDLLYLYHTLGDKDNAIQYGKKCIDIARETGQKRIEALACLGLLSLYRTDEKDNAIQYGKKCIELAMETKDKETEMEAHRVLAYVYNDSMQLNEESLSIGAGMAIATELGDKIAEEEFKLFLSNLYATVGLFNKAREEPSVKKLIEVPTCSEDDLLDDLEQAVKTDDKTKKFRASFRLNSFYDSKKEHEIKQIKLLEQLKEMDIDPPVNFFCVIKIGRLYYSMGKDDEALQCFKQGLPTAESCTDNTMRSEFYYSLGELLFVGHKELNLAERYLREAIRCFEAVFTTLGSRDEFKISIFDKYVRSYKILVLLIVKKAEKIEEALLVLDRCRARALKDLMISNYEMEQEGNNDEHLEYSDVLSLVLRNDFSIFYYSLCFDVAFLKFFLGETSLHFSYRVNNFLGIYVDALLDELGVREVVRCEDRSLDKEHDIMKEQSRCIEDHEELNQATASLLNLDSRIGESNENSAETKGFILEVLFAILECDRILSSKQDEVVIIPEGPLYQVAFPALQDPRTGKYLSETKRIRLAPSLATLKYFEDFPTDQTSKGKPLIIGDPLVGNVMMNGEERYIKPLPGARQEAAEISLLLNTPALLTLHATKPAVIKRLQEGVSVVHIAAHGILSKATIVLAPSDEIRAAKIPDEEDYMLTMSDVQQAKVHAQLVVLSCCHSGRGEIRSEGVVGMCRAFLASGARAVVASLWAIEDSATLTFMKIFYGFLKNGKSASTSLQLTMNEMRNSTDYKEPKYWAPFFLMGDDVTLQL